MERGRKEKKKKVCFCRLNFFKTLYGFKSFFTPKEIQESEYGKWGAVIQKILCLCACVWVCFSSCVFLQADVLPHFLHPFFALVRPSPTGHIIQTTPALNSQTQGLRNLFTLADNYKGFQLSHSIKKTPTPSQTVRCEILIHLNASFAAAVPRIPNRGLTTRTRARGFSSFCLE